MLPDRLPGSPRPMCRRGNVTTGRHACVTSVQGERTWRIPPLAEHHTVATGVAGEPTAPGRRSGGPVNRKRLRLLARSQSASSVR
jgi:hypothetical protein